MDMCCESDLRSEVTAVAGKTPHIVRRASRGALRRSSRRCVDNHGSSRLLSCPMSRA